MNSPEGIKSYKKQDVEEFDMFKVDDEDLEGDVQRKHKSNKSRRSGVNEESEGLDSSGRKRSNVDRNESRRRSSGSSRGVDTEEDECEIVKENSSSKSSTRKKPEENTLERLSNWYQDGENDNSKYSNSGDKSVSKFPDNDSSQSRHKGIDERRENSKEKVQGTSEHGRNSRRRWDEPDANTVKKVDESDHVENFESRSGRMADPVIDSRDVKSQSREDRRGDYERGKRGRFESPDEERSAKRYHESENTEPEYERSTGLIRKKEQDKDGYKDGRSTKGRDDGWNRDGWRRRQGNTTEKDTKEGDSSYDHGRDWELPRRGWIDNERPRSGSRKDGLRTEAVKTSSKFGISNENYDVIEIQTRSFDYVNRDDNNKPSSVSIDERGRNIYDGSGQSGEDLNKDTRGDGGGGPSSMNLNPRRDEIESQGHVGQTTSSGSQIPYGNQEPSSFNRAVSQSGRGGVRHGRMGRGRPAAGRDNHTQVPLQMPMVGSPFGQLGMAPPLNTNMSPSPVPPISPNVYIPPFSPSIVWPGVPGPSGIRFPHNIGNPPNPGIYFNHPAGPGRGAPPNFNNVMSGGRGQTPDKSSSGGWVPPPPPPRTNAPPGKAPSRGEQNDYSQNFVDTGMRPQNFIRELELTSVVEDYPKLRELLQKKDEIVAKVASTPMYYKCDLREQELSPEFFGTKFDVILIDPPWEEYVHRAPGVTDHMEHWTFEEIMNLKIEAVADTPSFIFLWVGDGVGLEQGRQCLKKWGFRRCEDICWVKTNKTNATPGLRHDSHTLLQRSKEHCLMGIKGTVRRSTDGHIIHANIDTDVIIAEEPPYGSTAKPEDMYRIVEHFALGRRRLELFGEDHNIRTGWLTVGKGLSSSNFNSEVYVRNFADKDGKVWQGGGGRNPPPDTPHLVVTTPEIEALRPKSPMKNQLQLQQQHQQQQQQAEAASLTLAAAVAAATKRPPSGNSPQNQNPPQSANQEASSSSNILLLPTPQSPWISPPLPTESFKGRENGQMADDTVIDVYGYNSSFGQQVNADFMDFESHRAMNM
ncbi:hypothetical protein DM860_013662 [Cuscuta australis]|uniref:Methyltransferase-like protein 1 n=1 Tax=Cuscuta australis TaxID=267555 RepID=A0A328EC69_9ASTE|nr:hypothetical protein DM860_013662 [Cuscuta australis]